MPLIFIIGFIVTAFWFSIRAKAAGKNNIDSAVWVLIGTGYLILFMLVAWNLARSMAFEDGMAAIPFLMGSFVAYLISVFALGLILLPAKKDEEI
jgi:hypothetical protein